MVPPADNLNNNELTIRHLTDGFSYVVFDNNCNTFVPAAVFQEKDKRKYLDLLGLTEKDSVVCADFIELADAYNVYAISKKDFEAAKNLPEKLEIRHSSTALVEDLIKDNLERTDDYRVYLNVKNQIFEMIVLNGSKLLFDNHFRFKTKEDFLYFLLFSVEQLHLDAGSVPVYFLGMIEEKSAITEIVSRYFRDIRFMSKDYLNKPTTCE